MKLKLQDKRRYLVYATIRTGWDDSQVEWWTGTWNINDGGYFILDLPMVGATLVLRESQARAIRSLPARPFVL